MKFLSQTVRVGVQSIAALAILSSSVGIASGEAFAQAKPRVSVPSFKNETNWWWWRSNTATELGDALSNELSATGSFNVVERQKLSAVLSEQELTELGLTKKSSGAKKGELTGAQYVILGKVTAFEENVSNKSSGRSNNFNIFGIGFGGGQEKKEQEAYIAIDLRVVDTTTGEVSYARTIEGRATDKSETKRNNFSIGIYSTGNNDSEEKKAPVGKALRAAMIEASEYLSCVMYKKDACVSTYEGKDAKRREGSKDVLKLD